MTNSDKIYNAVLAIFKSKDKHNIRDVKVKLSVLGDDVKVEVSQMYEYVDVSFDDLEALSNLFHTRKINFKNSYYYEGCETCDYGSKYAVDIYISEIPWDSL